MQVKNRFDSETKRKIVNSLYLSLLSASGAFLSAIMAGNGVKESAIIGASTGGAFIVNVIREYVSGNERTLNLIAEKKQGE